MKNLRSKLIGLTVVAGVLGFLSVSGVADDITIESGVTNVGDFTGEILPVFYVTDSRKSLPFYQDLGFRINHFHDYETGEHVKTWRKESAPIYAEMVAGDQKFAIHLIAENHTLVVDGMKHYFGVSDVDAHHNLVVNNGLSPSKIYDRPWMRMFYIEDPDGHIIFFFTRPDTLE